MWAKSTKNLTKRDNVQAAAAAASSSLMILMPSLAVAQQAADSLRSPDSIKLNA